MAEIWDFASQTRVKAPRAKKIKADVRVDSILRYLKSNKADIDNIICIVKYKDESADLVYNHIDMEHWARATKLLDYKIFNTIYEESEEYSTE